MSNSTSQTQAATPIDLVELAAGRAVGRHEIVRILGEGRQQRQPHLQYCVYSDAIAATHTAT